jgi:hypothetical protein
MSYISGENFNFSIFIENGLINCCAPNNFIKRSEKQFFKSLIGIGPVYASNGINFFVETQTFL